MITTVLSDKDLEKMAPAIFAKTPADFVSDRYTFVPTNRIIDEFRALDFFPVRAQQVQARSEEEMRVGKHLVSLRHKDSLNEMNKVGDSVPEILLANAHNWQTSYQLRGAIFRFICENGMIVADQEFGDIRQIHKEFNVDDIVLASKQFLGEMGDTFEKIETFKSIELDPTQMRQFGRTAARLRWEDAGDVMGERVLEARRTLDEGTNLWLTMNRAQENLIRGGFKNHETNRTVREVTGIDSNLEINEKLWGITEEFAHRLN